MKLLSHWGLLTVMDQLVPIGTWRTGHWLGDSGRQAFNQKDPHENMEKQAVSVTEHTATKYCSTQHAP